MTIVICANAVELVGGPPLAKGRTMVYVWGAWLLYLAVAVMCRMLGEGWPWLFVGTALVTVPFTLLFAFVRRMRQYWSIRISMAVLNLTLLGVGTYFTQVTSFTF